MTKCSYSGLYVEAPPKEVPFSGLKYTKGRGDSRVEAYERVGKSFM